MVDLSGGPDGPLELAFSNDVFILPGIVVVGLSGKEPPWSIRLQYFTTHGP